MCIMYKMYVLYRATVYRRIILLQHLVWTLSEHFPFNLTIIRVCVDGTHGTTAHYSPHWNQISYLFLNWKTEWPPCRFLAMLLYVCILPLQVYIVIICSNCQICLWNKGTYKNSYSRCLQNHKWRHKIIENCVVTVNRIIAVKVFFIECLPLSLPLYITQI